LRAVVAGLLQDPKRRFSYVEQAYFQVWFETQSRATQEQVRALVASKQLVFLNGGFSMHDEASPSFVDMLDNTAIGQRHIVDNFGLDALPSITWQIDPFGHSAFQGVLSSLQSGYQGVMWGREDAQLKQQTLPMRGYERVWLPSPSLGGSAASFAGIFYSGYGPPGSAGRCDGNPTNATCGRANAATDFAGLAADIWGNRIRAVRGNDVLLNFGTDFQWENAVSFSGEDFGNYFDYLDGIIEALNNDPYKRFNAFYSVASDYVASQLSHIATLPAFVTDFMPYSDSADGHNLWTGYFTSRPAFKGFVRESSSVLQTARQLQALVGGVADLGSTNPLFALERAMGVTQHHDSVSGTGKENVNCDYAMQLDAGRVEALMGAAEDVAAATQYYVAPFASCSLNNVTLCPSLEAGHATVAVLYNSLAQPAAAAPVRVAVGMPAGVASYAVFDALYNNVTAQLVPLSPRDLALRALYNATPGAQVVWLAFTAPLPAAGFSSFFIMPVAAHADAPHTHASVVTEAAGDSTVTNGRLTLTASAATGFVSRYQDSSTGVDVPLAQSWSFYVGFDGNSSMDGSTQASGAYIFRPKTETATPIGAGPASLTLVTGPVVNEFVSSLAYVDQRTSLWAGADHAVVEWTVGPVDVSDGQSHEVITRYDTGLATNAAWTTDSNCHEHQQRRRNWRGNYTVTISEPVSGNYYPTNCMIKTSSPAVTFAVAVDRSEASGSLADGQLEIMVHRRLTHDDHRGVGEPLNEPGVDGRGLIIRGTHLLVAAPAAAAPAAYKRLQLESLSRPTAVKLFAGMATLSPPQWLASYTPSASILAAPLPASIHLTTVHVYNATNVLLRLTHVFEAGEDAALSADVTLSLATLFAGKTVTAATEMTMPGSQPLARVPQTVYRTDGGASYTMPVVPPPPAGAALTVTLSAMQVRTWMCAWQASGA
jgi:hypothetical protein